MLETVETLTQRVTRLEEAVEDITLRLSGVLNQLEIDCSKNKKQDAAVAREILERMGISGDPIPAEELQARMVRNGIQPEGNEFSSAIIEERGK